jgi:hypothetical protein
VLAAIVHENHDINLKFIRGRENKHWADLLLAKMRDISKFSDHDMARPAVRKTCHAHVHHGL